MTISNTLRSGGHRKAVTVAGFVMVAALAAAAQPGTGERRRQGSDQAEQQTQLMAQVDQLWKEGRYVELPKLLDAAVDLTDRAYGRGTDRYSIVNGAGSLTLIASMYSHIALYEKALQCGLRADGLYEKLYGKAGRKFQFQDPHQLYCLNLLAEQFLLVGEPQNALGYAETALAQAADENELRKRHIPAWARPTDGDTLLADCSYTLGRVALALGKPAEALPRFEDALKQRRKAYADLQRYPVGEPSIAACLIMIGQTLQRLGRSDDAGKYLADGVRMNEALVPRQDQPELAAAWESLAAFQLETGKDKEAEGNYVRALRLYERLYPFPYGHPDTADCVAALGSICLKQGDPEKAADYLERATGMYSRIATRVAIGSPEAVALAFAAALRFPRDQALSAFEHVADSDARAYGVVWLSKAIVGRAMESRSVAVRVAAKKDAKLGRAWDELLVVRRQLSQVLNGGRDLKKRDAVVAALTRLKQSRELEIAVGIGRSLPGQDSDMSPDLLSRRLAAQKVRLGAAFVDLYRYNRAGADHGSAYAAFLLLPGGQPRRIDLGPAAPIEAALLDWRRAIIASKDDTVEGERVRGLVWDPISRFLPSDIRTLLVSPDGDLSLLPWAALPVADDGTPLLERLTGGIGLIQDGPSLTRDLSDEQQRPTGPGRVLAVGGVNYGPVGGSGELSAFKALANTLNEADQVVRAVGDEQAVLLKDDDPTYARLEKEMPGFRGLHMATHGFFREAAFLAEQRRWETVKAEWRYFPSRMSESAGAGVASPLSFVGLALAGANRPTQDGTAGIMTGEEIAGLPLANVWLVVLSACHSGLGVRVSGEGTLGLPRAFHAAGCHNVVSSLWEVSDAGTPALMGQFYRELKTPSPLMALRAAQRETLQRSGEEAASKGPHRSIPTDNEKAIQAPEKPSAKVRSKRAGIKVWGAFVLSGGV